MKWFMKKICLHILIFSKPGTSVEEDFLSL